MLGMLLKDYYSLRSYFKKQIFLMIVLYLILALALQNMSFFSTMMMMYAMMIYMSAFSVDASSCWDAYACTTPVKPVSIVGARGLLLLIGIWGLGSVTALISMCGDVLLFGNPATETLGVFLAVAVVYTFVGIISLPIFYKIGAERGRMAMTILFIVPFVAVIWVGSMWDTLFGGISWESLNWPLIVLITLLVMAVLCVVSFLLAVRIYRTKEY